MKQKEPFDFEERKDDLNRKIKEREEELKQKYGHWGYVPFVSRDPILAFYKETLRDLEWAQKIYSEAQGPADREEPWNRSVRRSFSNLVRHSNNSIARSLRRLAQFESPSNLKEKFETIQHRAQELEKERESLSHSPILKLDELSPTSLNYFDKAKRLASDADDLEAAIDELELLAETSRIINVRVIETTEEVTIPDEIKSIFSKLQPHLVKFDRNIIRDELTKLLPDTELTMHFEPWKCIEGELVKGPAHSTSKSKDRAINLISDVYVNFSLQRNPRLSYAIRIGPHEILIQVGRITLPIS